MTRTKQIESNIDSFDDKAVGKDLIELLDPKPGKIIVKVYKT